MKITQLIDQLRTVQAVYGSDLEIWIGQASGSDLAANCIAVTKVGTDGHKLTIYPNDEEQA